jgi:hypothetical protein
LAISSATGAEIGAFAFGNFHPQLGGSLRHPALERFIHLAQIRFQPLLIPEVPAQHRPPDESRDLLREKVEDPKVRDRPRRRRGQADCATSRIDVLRRAVHGSEADEFGRAIDDGHQAPSPRVNFRLSMTHLQLHQNT